MRHVRATRGIRLAAAAIAVWLAAGCGGGNGTPPQPSPDQSTSPGPTRQSGGPAAGALSWIIGGNTLSELRAADPDGRLTKEFFDTPNAFVVTTARNWSIPAGWSSTPTLSFTSYSALQSALDSGKLDPRIRAVLYDNESWNQTPPNEQSDPAHYDQLAAQLAHQHNLLFIATPAVDLVRAASGDRFNAFLATGLVGSIAPDADVIDVQAQSSEASAAKFDSFVRSAAAQARKGHPGVRVLAGISTNPAGQPITAQAVGRAVQSVRGLVDGFWLNDPGPSAACPTCAGPYPQVALAILAGLAASGAGPGGSGGGGNG